MSKQSEGGDNYTDRDLAIAAIPECLRPEVVRFLESIELERGLSPHTTAAYASDLSQFAQYARNNLNAVSWDVLTAESVNAYSRHMASTLQYAASTASRKVSAICMFSRYRTLRGEFPEKDFAEMAVHPRLNWMSETLPKTLSVSEIESIINTKGPGKAQSVRDRAILEFLYSTGARVSEVCAVKFGDLDFTEGVVLLRGKGSKERLALLGDPCISALQDYVSAGRPQLVKPRTGQHVFISIRGTPLTSRFIRKMVNEAAVLAKVKVIKSDNGVLSSEVTPHTFRHSCATHLLQGGADMRVIQELLGHADVGTTEIYAKTDPEMLLDAHALCHPRSKFKSNRGS